MYLLVPSNSKQLIERALWFKSPIARKLAQEKGVKFGFELKGESETIQKPPSLFWGYHLPTNFAEEYYYHAERRDEMLENIAEIAKLKPNYVNIHGPKLWWKPKQNEYIKRYEVRSSTAEFLKLLDFTIDLFKKLHQILPQLTFENTTLVDYYREKETILPITCLQTSIGSMLEMFYIQEQTGIEILCDIEHLIVGLNFLNRKKNYAGLKVKHFGQTKEERKISKIFGYQIKKGYIPYTEPKLDLSEILKKMKVKRFHVTGSTRDIKDNKDITHGPIKKDDQTFRRNLRLILTQKPESILLETASSYDNPCYSYLRPNETELSFYQLCEILLEEL